jgi:hypothetical protein
VSDTTETIRRQPVGSFATGIARAAKNQGDLEGTFATGMGRLQLPAQRLARGSFAEGMMRAHDRAVLHQGSFAEGLGEPEVA